MIYDSCYIIALSLFLILQSYGYSLTNWNY